MRNLILAAALTLLAISGCSQGGISESLRTEINASLSKHKEELKKAEEAESNSFKARDEKKEGLAAEADQQWDRYQESVDELRVHNDKLVALLIQRPHDKKVEDAIMVLIGNAPSFSIHTYETVLDSLPKKPALRPFALRVGRIRYGHERGDNTVTMYDEIAIMNDINAHSYQQVTLAGYLSS